MEFNFKKAKTMSMEEIYMVLKPMIKKIYKTYRFSGLTAEEMKSIIIEEIDYSMSLNFDNQSYGSYLSTALKRNLDSRIQEKLKDQEQGVKIISQYINTIMTNDTLERPVVSLTKLSKFFTKYRLLLDPDMTLNLMDKSPILKHTISRIVEENDEKSLGKLYNNYNIKSLINGYQLEYGMDIEDSQELDLPTDYTLDGSQEYYKAIFSKPLLTPEEVKELSLRYKEGDITARNKLIEHNMRLVIKNAKKYHTYFLSEDDLIEEGTIGLMKAIDKFDPMKGYRFSTYATWWIRQAITRAIANTDRTIRIPAHQLDQLNRYNKTKCVLANKLLRKPTMEEIADEMEISIENVRKLDLLRYDATSINTLLFSQENEDAEEIQSFIQDDKVSVEESGIAQVMRKNVRDLIASALTEREAKVIRLRFGLEDGNEYTLKATGEVIGGVTRERVRQIQEKALYKLRLLNNVEEIVEYTDDPKALERSKTYRLKYRMKNSSKKK